MSKNHRYVNTNENDFDVEAEKASRREKMNKKKSHNKKDKDYKKKYENDDDRWN